MTNELIELADRATAYLAHGGLFNPEMAEHGAVRDLILDCRDMLRKMAEQKPVAQVVRRMLGNEPRIVIEEIPGSELQPRTYLYAAPVPAITAEQKPVAWYQPRFIHDRDGRRIGIDDPDVSWGADCPIEDGTWYPMYEDAPVPAITAEQKAEVLRLADECRFAGEACHQFILTDYESNGWTDEEIQERREQVYSTMGQRRKALIAYLDKLGGQ